MASLAARKVAIVLGTHNFYELAKTFGGSTAEATFRGRTLFSYLRSFFDVQVLCAKEINELLVAEMSWVKSPATGMEAFLSGDDRTRFGLKVEGLAAGIFNQDDAALLKNQSAFASGIRASQIRHFHRRPEIKESLKSISAAGLSRWIQIETFGPVGFLILASHIQGRFPEVPNDEVREYASALLTLPARRIARGLVSTNLYYNWRCANRDSIPADLFDDMYHVLNATYCDIYATKESRQAEYATLLLTSNTRVKIYDGKTPLDQWLEELATECETSKR